MIPSQAYLQLHVAALLYGLSALFGQALEVPPVVIVCGRGLFALAVLVPLCLWARRSPEHLSFPPLGVGSQVTLMLLGCALAGHWVLFFMAIQAGGVAVATLGFATFPVFTAVTERLVFGYPMGRKAWAIVALATLGLTLVGPGADARPATLTGLAWGVLSGAVYAGIAIANKRLNIKAHGFTLSLWQMLGIVLVTLPFVGGQWAGVTPMGWLLLAGLGVLCTGLAYTLFIGSLQHVSANTAAVVIALEPVYAIAGAWLLFGNRPTLAMAAGGALILGAVAWASHSPSKPVAGPL